MRALAVAFTLLALLVAGCGGDDDGGGEAVTQPATTEEASSELDTELRAAVIANDIDEARRLLDEGANPNAPNDARESAFLHASSELGPDPAMLELLLANGADVDARDANNSTALIRAAQRGYPELVEPLVAAEPDLDHVNDLNFTALLATVIFGDGTKPYLDIVQTLVDAGADVSIPDVHGQTPRQHAEISGQTEVAGILGEAETAG